jgi:hypothetical protein
MESVTTLCDIVAFREDWSFRGIVNPTGRNYSIVWSDINAAISYITAHQPDDERWLLWIRQHITEDEE